MTEKPELENLSDPLSDPTGDYKDLMDEAGVVHFEDDEHANMALGEWLKFSTLPGTRVRVGDELGTMQPPLDPDNWDEKSRVKMDGTGEIRLVEMDEYSFPHEFEIDRSWAKLAKEDEAHEQSMHEREHGSDTGYEY